MLLASERSEQDTLRGNSIENRGYFFVYICVDIHMSFYTLTLAFLCLLCGLSLSVPPLNRIFRFSDPVSFKEINCLSLRIRLFLNDTRRT